ncbi:hypothetical protein MW887_000750 [Aspergillus wentii]|nr:hypothetical protein MW887_000750 [Aspergillus wentii]
MESIAMIQNLTQYDGIVYLSIASSAVVLFTVLKRLLSKQRLGEKEILQNGYKESNNSSMWKMQTSDYPLYILPMKYLPSLRLDKRVDLPSHVHDQYQSKYTNAMCSSSFMKSTQIDLNNNLAAIIPDIIEEMNVAINRELPSSKDWQSIQAFEKLLRIIGSVSGRMNVGPEISRNTEWLDLYTQYPIDFFGSISAITQWPSFLRPLIQYTLPQLRRVNQTKARLGEILAPEFEKRRKAENAKLKKKPNTMLQWVWDSSEEKNKSNEHQSMIHILATVPTTYTVAFAATQALFDLAARPEYIPILREEFQSVLDSCNGNLTKEAFSKMTKLDSFMKESQRITPLALVSFERKALDQVTLPDGTHIPKGAHIAAPSYHIGRDAQYFEDPDTFDGLRFHKLQQAEFEKTGKPSTKHQYVSVNETSLHFGYGLQACPGRWFAAIELKLLLGSILMEYDLALEDAGEGRPKSEIDRFFIYPDPTKMVALKRRV